VSPAFNGNGGTGERPRRRASRSRITASYGITRQAVYNRLHSLEQRAATDPEFLIPDLDTEEIPDLEVAPHRDQTRRSIDSAS
jgi:hypothetical protein